MAQTTENPPAADPNLDPVTGLYRMSRTAGVGLQDYTEVNAFAVASVVCGMASWLIYFTHLLYVIPALAILLGIWALVRIIGSNGTQTGIIVALLGVALGAGTVGYKAVQDRAAAKLAAADNAEIREVIARLSSAVREVDLDKLHPLFEQRFHDRVKPEIFRQRFQAMAGSDVYGRVESIRDNGIINIEAASGAESQRLAQTMLLLDTKRATGESATTRVTAAFIHTPDGWRILNLSELFPVEAPQGR